MAVHHDKWPQTFQHPKVGPNVDDDTWAAMAGAMSKTVEQTRNASPWIQWTLLGFVAQMSAERQARSGIAVPQSARDYWASMANQPMTA